MHFETLEKARQPHDIARQNNRTRPRDIAVIRGPEGYCEECGPNIGDRWIRVYENRRKQPEDAEAADG